MAGEDPVDDNFEYQMNHITIKMSKEMSKILKNIEMYQSEVKKLRHIINDLTTEGSNKLCKFYNCVIINYIVDVRENGSSTYRKALRIGSLEKYMECTVMLAVKNAPNYYRSISLSTR